MSGCCRRGRELEMKKIARKAPALCNAVFLMIAVAAFACPARSQQQTPPLAAAAGSPLDEPVARAGPEPTLSAEPDRTALQGNSADASATFTESRLGSSLLKNIALDQKAIWTSPARWRLQDTEWILPFAAVATASIAADSHISTALTRSAALSRRSNTFSNYGVAALGGAAGGLYLLGRMTGDNQKSEAGILAGEAGLDAVGVTTALQYAFGRERPGSGEGGFWHQGTSFPSDHSAAAWAVASVIAHEYPGPWTKILAYGLASAVSASRVTGKDHFPTDVLAGAAIGWFVGQHVYRAHHDPELGGASWATFQEARDAAPSANAKNSGSPYIPLDSWIYPEIDRLIALGYIHSAFQDVRPMTRLACAMLVEEAGESLEEAKPVRGDADRVYAALAQEFPHEFSVLAGEGGRQSIHLESLYSSVTAIHGQPLNDSYHFGQTIIDNFGRPYQEGFNSDDGFSGYGVTGRYTVYARGEFQYAPSAAAYSLATREAIAAADVNPLQPPTALPVTSQFALEDAYVAANVAGWTVSVGKQDLWWGRGVGGALLFSDNAEPIYMFRVRPTESITLPWIFSWLGPMQGDFFVGQLAGNLFPARPLIHGLKLTAKRTRYLEASLMATSEFGGVGRALTMGAVVNSFFSVQSSDLYSASRNPGKRTIGADFTYALPHLRDWVQFYANGLLPEDNPTTLDTSFSPIYIWHRLAIRTGIYLPRLPGLPKLDFRVESAYTDPPTPRSVGGMYIYWNNFYHDLYTNKNNLIGDWVGREGMGFQGWTTYWIRPRSSVQLAYRHARVAGDFIPSGVTQTDASATVNWLVRGAWSVSAGLQYERWRAPVLAPSAQTNWTSSLSVTFWPRPENK
jgi:membrane-associated phospholipid phosphatase